MAINTRCKPEAHIRNHLYTLCFDKKSPLPVYLFILCKKCDFCLVGLRDKSVNISKDELTWVDLLDCRACLERAFLWDSDSSSRTGVRYDLTNTKTRTQVLTSGNKNKKATKI